RVIALSVDTDVLSMVDGEHMVLTERYKAPRKVRWRTPVVLLFADEHAANEAMKQDDSGAVRRRAVPIYLPDDRSNLVVMQGHDSKARSRLLQSCVREYNAQSLFHRQNSFWDRFPTALSWGERPSTPSASNHTAATTTGLPLQQHSGRVA